MLAVEALMPNRPDFVLSGIDHGQNMGEDVLYSGTVAAAMEGLSLGIPSVAISFAGGDLRADVSMLSDQDRAVAESPATRLFVAAVPCAHAAEHQHAAAPRERHYWCSADPTWEESLFGFSEADAGSLGAADLLDRWRLDRLSQEKDIGFSRDSGWLHISHSSTPGPHPSRNARFGGDVVAAPIENEQRGPRRRLVELLQQQGIRDLAVLNAIDRIPGTCSCRLAFGTALTKIRRFRSGTARRFAAVHSRPLAGAAEAQGK